MKERIKVLKLCAADWKNASRNRRELEVCRELGMEVTVMAKGLPGDVLREDNVQGFRILRMNTRPLGTKAPVWLNRIISVPVWAHTLRRIPKDIISCCNLTPLLIGWLSTRFTPRKKRPKLVYDSHEFEVARSGSRGGAMKWAVTHLERFLMKRCAFSVMVNDSIADAVQKLHKLEVRPLVVRNIPPFWQIDEGVCREKKRELCAALGVPEDTFLVMYHGGILRNRGIEALIEQVRRNPHIAGVILGDSQEEAYLLTLQKLTEDKDVASRVFFHKAVPIEELWQYVGAADVGMVVLKNVCMNHFYSLPNKFFENIQSLTPVIASDFPEIGRIVSQYDIGLLCDPDDMDAMAGCIERMRTDAELYGRFKENLRRAKDELCWENERAKLVDAYREIMT